MNERMNDWVNGWMTRTQKQHTKLEINSFATNLHNAQLQTCKKKKILTQE